MSQAPDNEPAWYDRPQPAPRCKCGHPAVTVDIYNGHRCRCHHARYDPQVVADLLLDGWPAVADAYKRTWSA